MMSTAGINDGCLLLQLPFAGDPLYDIIPIHLDVFRGHPKLLKQFLESYKLPLVKSSTQHNSTERIDKFGRLSYHAM